MASYHLPKVPTNLTVEMSPFSNITFSIVGVHVISILGRVISITYFNEIIKCIDPEKRYLTICCVDNMCFK